ncbi:MAG: hypothetical protein ACREQ5_34240, partial [Candidatus Dormibacteria bacterium]
LLVGSIVLAGTLGAATLVLELRVALPAPPLPAILTAPSNITSSTTATFTFRDTRSGVVFGCSLDGRGYRDCASGTTYTGLTDGSHTFHVTATDHGGAPSTPATFSWVVDTGATEKGLGFPAVTAGPPTVEIRFPAVNGQYQAALWNAGCAPAAPGICGSATALTSVTAVRVSILQASSGRYWNGSGFTATSETLNGATLQTQRHGTTGWTYAFSLPRDGSYRVHAVATDSPGTTIHPGIGATVSFRVGAPSPPPAPVITTAPTNPTSATDAEFRFTDAQRGVTFVCSLDGGAVASCPDDEHDGDADYANLAPGSHTFQVEAAGAAGNRSAPATFTWTIVVSGSFPISGSISQLLSPGVTVPLDLS